MAQNALHPRHGALLRMLRISLVVGALYDLAFAITMVVAPQLPERLLGLPQPGERFYLWLIAVFLGMLAGFYCLAAYDPISYRGNIDLAILGRAIGGCALLAAMIGRPDLAGLLPLGIADCAFAGFHAACWWPIRPR